MVKITHIRARLVRREKYVVERRFIIEITVHEVPRDDRYPDGLKWSLLCFDRIHVNRILMDNHHPKGPHIHIGDKERPYEFQDLETLCWDFRRLIYELMGAMV